MNLDLANGMAIDYDYRVAIDNKNSNNTNDIKEAQRHLSPRWVLR